MLCILHPGLKHLQWKETFKLRMQVIENCEKKHIKLSSLKILLDLITSKKFILLPKAKSRTLQELLEVMFLWGWFEAVVVDVEAESAAFLMASSSSKRIRAIKSNGIIRHGHFTNNYSLPENRNMYNVNIVIHRYILCIIIWSVCSARSKLVE